MEAYIVSTEYQLFNAINMQHCNGGASDIILLEYGTGVKRYKEALISAKIFDQVYVIEPKMYKGIRWYLYTIKNMFLVCDYMPENKKEYDRIYIAGTEPCSKILFFKLKSKNTELYYFEDGLGSYYYVLNDEQKKLKSLMFKLRYGKDVLDLCKGLYVYEPNYVYVNPRKIEVLSIPKVDSSDEKLKDKLQKVFNVNEDNVHIFKEDYIFFAAYFDTEEEYELEEKIIQLLERNIGAKNCCIKMHPSDSKRKEYEYNMKKLGNIGNFELNNYYQSLNDKVLIAVTSTACLSPRLLYAQEPYIIFLYKIFASKFPKWGSRDETVQNFKRNYNEPERVFIPTTEEEFVRILKQISC